MISFLTIFLKNLQIMLKSKFSIGVVVIAPLALTALFSFGILGSGLSNIEASFYSTESGELPLIFLESLRSNSFIVEETSSNEECIGLVKQGRTNVCIVLKEDINGLPLPNKINDRDIRNFKRGFGVEMQVDFSKQRIVWGIINSVQIVVGGLSDKIQQEVIKEVSSKFDSSLVQIDTLKNNVDYLELRVKDSKDHLTNINNNLGRFKSQSLNTIDNILITVDQLSSLVPFGANNSQISSITSSLLNLRAQINSTNIDPTSIYAIQNEISQVYETLGLVKTKISIVQNELIFLRNSLSDTGSFNLNKFIEPIPLSYVSVNDQDVASNSNNLNLVDYLLPSFISFFIVFISMMLSSSLVIKERSSNSHIRNYLSRTSGFNFVFGNLIYLLFVILIQVGILLVFADLSVNSLVSDNWESLTVYLALGIAIFSALGMVIGYILNSRDTVTLTAVCVSLVFILFSPLINPLETMPQILREVFSKSPAVIVESGVSKAIIFNTGINGTYISIIFLSSVLLVLFILCLILHVFNKERIVKE